MDRVRGGKQVEEESMWECFLKIKEGRKRDGRI